MKNLEYLNLLNCSILQPIRKSVVYNYVNNFLNLIFGKNVIFGKCNKIMILTKFRKIVNFFIYVFGF